MKTDIEIAQEAELENIADVAGKIGIEPDDLELYGKGMRLQLAEREEEAAYGAALSGMIAAGKVTLEEAVGV